MDRGDANLEDLYGTKSSDGNENTVVNPLKQSVKDEFLIIKSPSLNERHQGTDKTQQSTVDSTAPTDTALSTITSSKDDIRMNIQVTRKMSNQMLQFVNSRHRSSGVGLSDIPNDPEENGRNFDDEIQLGMKHESSKTESYDDSENELNLCSPRRKDSLFLFSCGISSDEAVRRLQKYGKNELPEIVVPRW